MAGSVNFVYFCKSDVSAVHGHPRELILAPIVGNRKRVCDFLLVCHSNLGPILHRYYCAPDFTPHTYSTLILGEFPLDQIAHVGVNVSRDLELFGHEIIFEVFQAV